MNRKEITFGTVIEIKKTGSMVVELVSGCRALAYVKDGRGLLLNEKAKLSFTQEQPSDPVTVGDQIACVWRGSAIGKWTFRSTYQFACQRLQEMETDIWDANSQQAMMDNHVTDMIIPRIRQANPQLEIPAFPPREQLDEFHRKGVAIVNWVLFRRDGSNQMKDALLEQLAVSIFAKPKTNG